MLTNCLVIVVIINQLPDAGIQMFMWIYPSDLGLYPHKPWPQQVVLVYIPSSHGL